MGCKDCALRPAAAAAASTISRQISACEGCVDGWMCWLGGREGRGVTGCRAVPSTSFCRQIRVHCMYVSEMLFRAVVSFSDFLATGLQPASRRAGSIRRTKALLMRSKLLDSLWWFVLVLKGVCDFCGIPQSTPSPLFLFRDLGGHRLVPMYPSFASRRAWCRGNVYPRPCL